MESPRRLKKLLTQMSVCEILNSFGKRIIHLSDSGLALTFDAVKKDIEFLKEPAMSSIHLKYKRNQDIVFYNNRNSLLSV